MNGREMSDSDLAKLAGCTPSTISRIRRGLTIPEATLLLRIRDITAGEVTANDHFAAYEENLLQRDGGVGKRPQSEAA